MKEWREFILYEGRALREAAASPDWEQVRLNNGDPCFHVEEGRFCFRSDWWSGHPGLHKYVSLADLIHPLLDAADERDKIRTEAIAICSDIVRLKADNERLDAIASDAVHKNELQAGRLAAVEADNERLSDSFHRLEAWAKAYPLDVFPEPDFTKAHELLKAGGMGLDSISASNMRHVITQVMDIAREALEGKP